VVITAGQTGRRQAGVSHLPISLEKRDESRDLLRGSPEADGYEAEGLRDTLVVVMAAEEWRQ
jgi:hypothetical protein